MGVLAGQLKGLPEGSWTGADFAHNPDEVCGGQQLPPQRLDAPPLSHPRRGRKWERIVDGDDVLGHVQCVLQDPEVADLIWCGTEQGLWWSHDGGFAWKRWKEGVPAVPVRDIVLQERESDLVLGTFGRGVYIMDGLEVVRAWVTGGGDDDFGGAACTMFADAGIMAGGAVRPGSAFRRMVIGRGQQGGERVRCHFNGAAWRPSARTVCSCTCWMRPVTRCARWTSSPRRAAWT